MRTWLIFFLCFFSLPMQVQAQMRIAYVEGGEFIDYNLILNGTVHEMELLNIIENGRANLPSGFTSAELWAWLSENAGGDQVEFVADAFYSADWDTERQAENIEALASRDDIDLIFAFGTAAGIDVTQNIENVNIMNFSTTDPIASGISMSVEDSGNDFVHAKIEPDRYVRQLSLFYDIFQFETMGICYEDSERGRGDIGYSQILNAAELNGFALVEGIIPTFGEDEQANLDMRIACHEEIAPQVDAMYLTLGIGNETHRYVELLQPFIENKVPTFSQAGPQNVALGALMSMAAIDFNDMGYFEANTVRQILEGKMPREISQVYEGRTDLAINLRMALEIGWDLSFELLAAVDEIYQEITNTPQ